MKYKSRYGPVEFDVFINSNLAEDPLEISYISDEKKSAGGILLCVVWAHPNLRADGKMTSWQARKNLERYAPFHVQAYDDWKKHEKRHGPIDYFTFADTKQENGPVIAVRQIPRFIRFLRGQGFPIDPSEFENNLAPMPNPPAPQARRALINQLSAHAVAIGYVSGLADIYDGSYVLGINEYKLKDILSLNRVALMPLSLKAAKKQKT
ncbi:unnamed protein product [Aphanomyces euteiches]